MGLFDRLNKRKEVQERDFAQPVAETDKLQQQVNNMNKEIKETIQVKPDEVLVNKRLVTLSFMVTTKEQFMCIKEFELGMAEVFGIDAIPDSQTELIVEEEEELVIEELREEPKEKKKEEEKKEEVKPKK